MLLLYFARDLGTGILICYRTVNQSLEWPVLLSTLSDCVLDTCYLQLLLDCTGAFDGHVQRKRHQRMVELAILRNTRVNQAHCEYICVSYIHIIMHVRGFVIKRILFSFSFYNFLGSLSSCASKRFGRLDTAYC